MQQSKKYWSTVICILIAGLIAVVTYLISHGNLRNLESLAISKKGSLYARFYEGVRSLWRGNDSQSMENVALAEFSSEIELVLSRKTRPSKSAAVSFELTAIDPNGSEGTFRISFDFETNDYRGVVKVGEVFDFCPRLARIGVRLSGLKGERAIVDVPGLVKD